MPTAACALATLLAAPRAAAQRAGERADLIAPRSLVAVRLARGEAPVLDGHLGDAVWTRAPVATDFVQSRPDPGAIATFRTEARVAFDESSLYVAVRLHDPHPDSIVAPYPRRDDETTSDWVFVEIDSRHDHRTAFSLGVNPRGVQVDGTFVDDRNYDASWNAVWQAVTAIDSAGWTAEYRIPFSQLPLGRPAGTDSTLVFGLNVYRYVPRLGESSNWSPRLPRFSGIVSHFNELRDVAPPPASLPIELTPYLATRLAATPDDGATVPSLRHGASGYAGLDARARLAPSLSLAVTLHPDFGQVEVDPSVVNLTSFETFLPEQRPFFVEGADAFSFNGGNGIGLAFRSRGNVFDAESPFYSRRIGRAPHGGIPDGARGLYLPAATDLVGAAKVAGRAGPWQVGVLTALGQPERATFADSLGAVRSVEVEPRTLFGAGRLSRDFRRGESAVGALVTVVDRALPDSGALADGMVRQAWLVGIDGRHRFAAGTYELSGLASATRVTGSPLAIRNVLAAPQHFALRPDAAHLARYRTDTTRTALDGAAAQLMLAKPAGHWRWSVAGHAISPGFEANGAGFQRNSDWLLAVGSFAYDEYRPGPIFRRWSVGLSQVGAGWSFGGERRAAVASFRGSADLPNEWGGAITFDQELPSLSTELLRGGPAVALPARRNWSATLHSDSRHATLATVTASGFREPGTGGHGVTLGGELDARVNDRLRLDVAPSYTNAVDAWQYVTTLPGPEGDAAVVARLHQRTASVVLRSDLAFSSRLVLQLFAQPLVSSARYARFGVVEAPRATAVADRVRPVDAAARGVGDPSFDTRHVVANGVLRWEYRPGSALFVVLTDQRHAEDPAQGGLGASAARLLNLPATRVVLVKWSLYRRL